MDKLTAITPLGADTPRVDEIGTLVIREVVDQAMASVTARLNQADVVKASAAANLRLTLPEVGRVAEAGQTSTFWMGPDQWMITAPYDGYVHLAGVTKTALGAAASVVEQTDGWCRFDITGPAVCDLFERLCNVPVRTMAADTVTRSTIEHLGVFVWRLSEDGFAVIAPRSSAGSLHHALIAAATSIA